MTIWALRYKESERGPWIPTTIRGRTSDEAWQQWSPTARTPRNYHSVMVYEFGLLP